MNKMYRNLIRFGLYMIGLISIGFVVPEYYKGVSGFAFIFALVFFLGFILSQSVKDLENYLFKKEKL